MHVEETEGRVREGVAFHLVFYSFPLHRAVLACLSQLFLQICGISVTVAYAVTIYEEHLGFSAIKSRGLAIAMENLLVVGDGGFVLLVDRAGRRPLMLASAIVMTICMNVAARKTSQPNDKGVLYAATFFLSLYTLYFAVGFLGLPMVYVPEVAPLKTRAAIAGECAEGGKTSDVEHMLTCTISIQGASTATSWVANFVILMITPIRFENIQYRYWIVYVKSMNVFSSRTPELTDPPDTLSSTQLSCL